MNSNPSYWENYYDGTDEEKHLLRHYSFSDRIRYYWDTDAARNSVKNLTDTLQGQIIPKKLFNKFLPTEEEFSDKPLDPLDLLISKITHNLRIYNYACQSLN